MADSLKASEQGLEIVDQQRKKKGWNKDASAWLDAANDLLKSTGGNVSRSTLQRFWRKEPIRQENFVAICKAVEIEDWEAIINNPTQPTASPVLCSDSKEETWVGRGELINQLSQKLKGQCRVLIITGITGLGKTALAERLATVELREDYPNYKVVNFDEGVGTQDFVSAAENLLKQLGEKVTADERKNPNGLLNRLVQKLRSRRYLVQIDSLELLLKGQGDDDIARNEFHDELWWNFFNRLLADQDCQSRLILTSQDLPTQFLGSRYQERWTEEQLTGLNEAEQFELFERLFWRKEREIESESEAGGYLKRIGKAYEGHPLVIEVIAGEILAQPFDSNVVAYWHRYHQEFEAIEPARGHQRLQLQVKDRVRKSLKRLAHDVPYAYGLLCRSSVYRRPVPEPFWLAMLGSLTQDEKAAALGALKFRYLVFDEGVTSAGQFLLRQHNLIRSVAYELLKKSAKENSEWQEVHYTAADMWLTAYEPDSYAPNLEKVRGYLEAFHHLCEVEDWERASEILSIRLDTPTNEELSAQLGTWGYYHKQIELYGKLLDKLDSRWNAICLKGQVNAHLALAEYHPAIECCQQRLNIAQGTGNQQEEGNALESLGNAYLSSGYYSQAINYYQQYSVIAQAIGDRSGESKILSSLGMTYFFLGDYRQAIKYYQQSLTIARKICDRAGEGRALGNLGHAHYSLKEYHQAIEFHQQSLVISQLIGDQHGEGMTLGTLGYSLITLEQYSEALEHFQRALEIFRKIDARFSEGRTLNHLAALLQNLGHPAQAFQSCERALTIATELGITPLIKECQELKEKLLSEQV